MDRLLRRAVAALAVASLLVLSGAPPATAHAVLVSSNPVDGAVLEESPSSLTLTFDEEVDLGSTVIQLLDSTGSPITVGSPTGDSPDADETVVVATPFPLLPRGRYLVRWSTITSDDFHPVTGDLTFGVGVEVTPAGTTSDRAVGDPLESGARSVGLLGYFLAVGGFVLLLALRSILGRRPRAEATLVQGAILGAVLSLTGLVTLQGWLMLESGVSPSQSFLLFWGTAVISVLTLALSAALVGGNHGGGLVGHVPAGLGVVAGVTGAWGLGHLGHGSATAGGSLSTLHVVATACWAGGLVLLVALVVPARRYGAQSWGHDAIGLFGRVAVPAVVISVASGAALAHGLVPAWEGLVDTLYGRTLVLKLVLVAVAIGLGAMTALRSRSLRADRRISPRLLSEATAVVAVVVLAAALSGGQPPDDRRWTPTPDEAPTTGVHSANTGDLVVTLSIAPNQPGANFTAVRVLDTRRPSPGKVTGVLVDLGDGMARPAARQPASPSPLESRTDQGGDEWIVAADIDDSSARVVRVVVRRAGWDDSVVAFPWRVAPAPGTELGGTGIGGWWLALAACAVLGLAVLAPMALRRRPRQEDVAVLDLREEVRVATETGAEGG